MGMAASQARYLSLSARKTNTEYEGQQLNQQRLNLANQSADLFNQMLTMSVPTCPDSNDFTTLQYSWTDGINDEVISDYYQISTINSDYNYVVTSYRYENVYTGQSKKMNSPEVQATKTNHFSNNDDKKYTITQSTYKKESSVGAGDDSYTLVVERNGVSSTHVFKRADTTTDIDAIEEIDALTGRTTKAYAGDKATYHKKGDPIDPADPSQGTYTINEWLFDSDIKVNVPNKDYDPTQAPDPTSNPMMKEVTIAANTAFQELDMDDENNRDIIEQLLASYGAKYDPSDKYFFVDSGEVDAAGKPLYLFITGSEMDEAVGSQGDVAKVEVRAGDKTTYYTDGTYTLTAGELAAIDLTDEDPANWMDTLYFHSVTNDPTYTNFTAVGNCQLTPISSNAYNESEDMQIEIQQVIADMKANGNEIAYGNLSECFDSSTGEYLGGIYSFKLFGHTYYTTTTDLETAVAGAYKEKATADNGIDSQDKLMYYTSTYISTKIEDTKKALMETDGKGRFSTVKFEDDDTVYTLNCETITDEAAYRNAMNAYYYKQEQYDKAVADINAKTEIIQAEDRELQLRLEQLGTEQTALQTEMEACQKVVSKNIENSFKTFGG